MSVASFAMALGALMFAGFLIWGLSTGTIVGPGAWTSKKATEPGFFWFSVAFDAAAMVVLVYFAVVSR